MSNEKSNVRDNIHFVSKIARSMKLDHEIESSETIDDGDLVLELIEAIRKNTEGKYDLCLRGILYMIFTDYNQAIECFTESIKLDEKDASLYILRGFMYYNKNKSDHNSDSLDFFDEYDDTSNKPDYSRVIEDFSKVIILTPDDVTAYSNRAFIYSSINDYTLAIKDYTEILRLKPKEINLYLKRAKLYILNKNYDEAIKDYTEILKLKPDDVSILSKRIDLYIDKKEIDNAISDCSEIIRINPNDPKAYLWRANLYTHKDDYDSAINEYSELIQFIPDYVNAYRSRSNAYIYKGDVFKAIDDRTEVLCLKSDYKKIYSDRNVEFYDKGDKAQTILDYIKDQYLEYDSFEDHINNVERVIYLLDCLNTDLKMQIINKLIELNLKLGSEIKIRMFFLYDLMRFDDRSIQKIIHEMDEDDLAKILINADSNVKEKIFKNMSRRASAMLKESIEYFDHVNLKELEKAQQKLYSIIKYLEGTGAIVYE